MIWKDRGNLSSSYLDEACQVLFFPFPYISFIFLDNALISQSGCENAADSSFYIHGPLWSPGDWVNSE